MGKLGQNLHGKSNCYKLIMNTKFICKLKIMDTKFILSTSE